MTKKRDETANLVFMKKALKRHGSPQTVVTDGLRSYPAAMRDMGNLDHREIGRWKNNWVENSHLSLSASKSGRCCVSANEDATKVRIRARQHRQSLQPRMPPC